MFDEQEELERRVGERLAEKKEYACFRRKQTIWKIRNGGQSINFDDEKNLLGVFNFYGTAELIARHVRLRKTTPFHGTRKPNKCKYYIEYSSDKKQWVHYCTNKVHNKFMQLMYI